SVNPRVRAFRNLATTGTCTVELSDQIGNAEKLRDSILRARPCASRRTTTANNAASSQESTRGATLMHKNQNQLIFSATLLIVLSLSGIFTVYSQTSRNLTPVSPGSAPGPSGAPYYALLIGNNQYRYLPGLETAVNDADAVAMLLEESY